MIGIHLTAAANNYKQIENTNKRGPSFKSSALFSKNTMIDTSYKRIKVDSADYIRYIYRLVKNWCTNTVEINVETGRLQDIVDSKEACIFIMNHTKNQLQDFNAAKFFNTLLYREYIYHDMAKTCPRSKVLTNKDILEHQKDGGEKYRWMGLVPINAGIFGKDRAENAVTLKNLINELANSKINLFMFPEGALGIFTALPLKYKFQPGVSSIVKKVLDIKEKIKVIPLGFAHNKKESAIHIGEPVYFKKNSEGYKASRGNADSSFFAPELGELYKDKEEILLTENGKAVHGRESIPYISGILTENLSACSKEAKSDLLKADKRIYII